MVRYTATVFTCLSPVSTQVPSFQSVTSGNQLPSRVSGKQWSMVDSEVDGVFIHFFY